MYNSVSTVHKVIAYWKFAERVDFVHAHAHALVHGHSLGVIPGKTSGRTAHLSPS